MNRLTKKNNGTGSWTQLGDKYLPAHNIKHKQCVNKLGQLEDLEEDIGMSLLTLFRILKLGEIICKFRPIEDPKKILLLSRKIKSLYYDGCYYMLGVYEDGDDGYIINFDYVYIKDYGVTWGITKKELGDDR